MRGVGGGGSLCPQSEFQLKPFHVAISKGLHVCVGISNSSIATDHIRNVEVRNS